MDDKNSDVIDTIDNMDSVITENDGGIDVDWFERS